MSLISLVTLKQEEFAQLKQELGQLLAPFYGFGLTGGEKVLFYLGQIWPAPKDMGVNPHPALIEALIETAYEAKAGEVWLAARAAPGFEFSQSWQLADYERLASYGAKVYDLADCPLRDCQSRLDLAMSTLPIALPLLQADCLVNVGKYRSAEGELFGAAISNLAAAATWQEQPCSPRALIDLHSIVVPDYHVIDAIRGKQGFQPQKKSALLAATDGLAMDTTLAALAGLAGGEIEWLALAAQYGLGTAHGGDIRLVGEGALEL